MGHLPVTERGNKYLLTFIDHFIPFCEAIPITRQDRETIAREFVTKIITQLAVSKKLLTDRGASFTSALIKETCNLLKVHKLQTISYHTQANGVCERMHKFLIYMLSHFLRKMLGIAMNTSLMQLWRTEQCLNALLSIPHIIYFLEVICDFQL